MSCQRSVRIFIAAVNRLGTVQADSRHYEGRCALYPNRTNQGIAIVLISCIPGSSFKGTRCAKEFHHGSLDCDGLQQNEGIHIAIHNDLLASDLMPCKI